ncbi:uncharacterized protein LOC133044968 isoform X1 [Dama dama]|uniref:uncharacterized protein LOC133044968 isoform X1 n=1 Tax=Dama dama TaxID=30532 RepID=UPI002A35C9DC|nr:uncharacterized protein LOC133044968 isoform X1 [Dama dama]
MLFQQSHLQLMEVHPDCITCSERCWSEHTHVWTLSHSHCQVMARGLLADFSNKEEDFLTVMGIMVRLSEDAAEPTVRTELMEQIPPLAIFLQENRSDFPVVLSECLIPVMVRYLTDTDNQIICKLSSVLSKCTVERLLFPRFCELCGYGKLFQVRKVVAILQKFYSNNDSALGFRFIMNSSYGSGTVLSGSEAYFRNAGNPHLGVVEETVLALQSDQNQDLAFFAALEPKRGNVTDLSMLQEQN